MPQWDTNESIRIYEVLNPSTLLEARDRLVAMFAGRSEDDDITFEISASGGRIWFADNAVMWQTKDAASLARTPSEAEIQARAFIGGVNTAVQNDRNLAEVGIDR